MSYLQFRGAWDAATPYADSDVVSFNGSKWIALAPQANKSPVEGADWTILGNVPFGGDLIVTVTTLPAAAAAAQNKLYRLAASVSAPQVLTAQGTPFSYPPFNSTFAASNAFDGDLNSSYAPANSSLNAYIGLDFGAGKAHTITQIRFIGRPTFESRLTSGVFQGSNTSDTAGFTNIASVGAIPAQGQYGSVTVTDQAAYRWVRYFNAQNSADIAELEFTGTIGNPDRIYITAQNLNGTFYWKQIA